MPKFSMTKKQKILLGIISLIIAISIYCSVKAEEIKGQFFLPISANYVDDLGVAGGLAYQDYKSKFIFVLQVGYQRTNTVNGTTPYQPKDPCLPVVMVPYSYNPGGNTSIEASFLIPLGTVKR